MILLHLAPESQREFGIQGVATGTPTLPLSRPKIAGRPATKSRVQSVANPSTFFWPALAIESPSHGIIRNAHTCLRVVFFCRVKSAERAAHARASSTRRGTLALGRIGVRLKTDFARLCPLLTPPEVACSSEFGDYSSENRGIFGSEFDLKLLALYLHIFVRA